MAKKTQIDRAIDALVDKRDAIVARINAEVAGIDSAIDALRAQARKRPRAVKTAAAAVDKTA